MYLLLSKRPSPTPYQWLVTTAASILFGNAVLTTIQLIWAATTASYSGPMILIQLILNITLPVATSLACFAMAYHCKLGKEEKKCCFCCCGLSGPLYYNINRRIPVIIVGLVHLLMVQCGFIVAPLLLVVAGLLPVEKAEGEQ